MVAMVVVVVVVAVVLVLVLVGWQMAHLKRHSRQLERVLCRSHAFSLGTSFLRIYLQIQIYHG